jgi:hypothetical protein
LNRIRNITHHVEKDPLSKDQVEYVRREYRLAKTHIAGQQPVVVGSVFLPNVGVGEEETASRGQAAE